MFGFGLLAMFGSRQIIIQGASLSGAGPLGVLCVAFIGVQKWEEEEKVFIIRLSVKQYISSCTSRVLCMHSCI